MTTLTLEGIEKLLDTLSPSDLFAQVPYKELVFATHPDRNPGDKKAADLFARIAKMYEEKDKPPIVVKGKKHAYTLGRLVAAGDLADIYEATSGTDRYILKISRIAGANDNLDVEQKHVTSLLRKAADTTYRLYVPTLVESFPAKDKIQKRVNVFMSDAVTRHTAAAVHARHPNLRGRHIAWLFKRLLVGIGFAHHTGIVHGAILPEHVLVDASGHGVQLVGWGQSVKVGSPIKAISAKYRDWYPPEVLAKKPAEAATDIYMAARLMTHLGGDCTNIPAPMHNFLRGLLLPGVGMRPGDAWALCDEFEKLLKTWYGPPRFVTLEMS